MAKSTREKIISAAFSFYRKPSARNISLSRIAKKVGITKAAIFKHFPSKDALQQAVNDKFFDDVAEIISEMLALYREDKPVDAMSVIVNFLINHREYVMYYHFSNMTKDEIFVRELRKRGVTVFDDIFDENNNIKNLRLYFSSVFAATTLFSFILFRFRALDMKLADVANLQEFSQKLARLVENGIAPEARPLSIIRLAELDELCEAGVRAMESPSDEMMAFAAVLVEHDISDVTIERMAEKLGLAKSSLYSRFKNKRDMIASLISGEVVDLLKLIINNLRGLDSDAERIYMLLQTQMAYFMARPQLIDVGKRLVVVREFYYERCDNAVVEQARAAIEGDGHLCSIIDVGMPVDAFFVLGWFIVLSGTTFSHCRLRNFSDDVMRAAIKDIYYMVEVGVGDVKTLGEERQPVNEARSVERHDAVAAYG